MYETGNGNYRAEPGNTLKVVAVREDMSEGSFDLRGL